MTTPYTYLIGWPELNIWYYGVRYAKDCHPNDLWVTYFTSSDYVKRFVINHGDPSIRQVRKIFTEDSILLAKSWEHRVLKRINAVKKSEWLNKNDRLAPPILSGDTHPKKRPEVRAKSSESMIKAWKNMDSITRENHRKKVGISSKNNWENMPDEKYDRICKLRSDIQIKKESEKTIEQKLKISKKQSDSAKNIWKNRSDKDRESHSLNVKKEMSVKVSCIGCHKKTSRTGLTRFHKICLETK